MNMTGLNVRKISSKLLIENLSQVRKRKFYMQGYFSSYPNDLAICTALQDFMEAAIGKTKGILLHLIHAGTSVTT